MYLLVEISLDEYYFVLSGRGPVLVEPQNEIVRGYLACTYSGFTKRDDEFSPRRACVAATLTQHCMAFAVLAVTAPQALCVLVDGVERFAARRFEGIT